MTPGPGATTEELLAEVIAVLADACREAGRRGLNRPRCVTADRLAASAGRMRPLADRLIGCAAVGDHAGLDRLLSTPRAARDWRELALALAFAGAQPGQSGPSRQRAAA